MTEPGGGDAVDYVSSKSAGVPVSGNGMCRLPQGKIIRGKLSQHSTWMTTPSDLLRLEFRHGPQGSTASHARLRNRHSSQAWGERRCGFFFNSGRLFGGPGRSANDWEASPVPCVAGIAHTQRQPNRLSAARARNSPNLTRQATAVPRTGIE